MFSLDTLTSPARISIDSLAAMPYMTAVRLRDKTDNMIMKYDAWFLVLLAVLMVLSFVLLSAMAIWCFYEGKGRFSGNWQWGTKGVSVWVECV